jgi:type II secretory pathway component PulJ
MNELVTMKTLRRLSKRSFPPGFTLIELLVVIAISRQVSCPFHPTVGR